MLDVVLRFSNHWYSEEHVSTKNTLEGTVGSLARKDCNVFALLSPPGVRSRPNSMFELKIFGKGAVYLKACLVETVYVIGVGQSVAENQWF